MAADSTAPSLVDSPPDAPVCIATAERPAWWRRHGLALLLAGAVLLVTVAVQWPVLSARAQYLDDEQYFNTNRLVRQPSFESAWRFLSEVTHPSTVNGYYQPLTMISLMLDRAMGGSVDDPRMFRVTSLALHALTAALVVLLLYRLFGAAWPAAFVGLLFGVHPTSVESVAWLAERKNVLSAFFALLCLLSYAEYARRRRWGYMVACALALLLSLLAKPVAVGLPLAMLLLDYWPLRRLSWRCVFEKVPLLVISVASAVVTYISQMRTVGTAFLEHEAPINRLLAVLHNNIFYLWKVFWPTELAPFYPIPEPMNLSQPMVLLGVIGSAVLIVALSISWRWTRAIVVGWAFFFLLIFPTIGVVGFTWGISANRFVYLPMVGLMLPVAAAAAWLWNPPIGVRLVASRAGLIVLAAAAAAGCAVITHQQLGNWRDSLTIQYAVLQHAPRCRQAHHNLASELQRRGDLDGAVTHYRAALEIDPESPLPQFGLATVLAQQGKLDAALQEYRRSLRLSPDRPQVYNGLGGVLAQLGRDTEALAVFNQCWRLFPTYAPAHFNLAKLLMRQPGAVPGERILFHLGEAVRLDPGNTVFRCALADFLAAHGQRDAAGAQYQQVLRIDPTNQAARAGLQRIRESRAPHP